MKIPDAITFMAADRQHADTAYAGDIIGLHNHGTINIGDSFTEGEHIRFTGIPELRARDIQARRAQGPAANSRRCKKVSRSLCEEGATQLFKPLSAIMI